jgi:MFS family permease
MHESSTFSRQYPIFCSIALALGAGIALGISRFAYTLFLPIMRADLHWSYFTSGNMNTANAIGYLLGALTCNWIFQRYSLKKVFIASTWITIFLIGATGISISANIIFLIRFLVGISCTWVFVSGGALAAKIGGQHPTRSGWILGIYYGGVGFGILISSIFVNEFNLWAYDLGFAHPWREAWFAMGVLAGVMGLILTIPTLKLHFPMDAAHSNQRISIGQILPMYISYFLYGLGYIGYMTFSVALVREIGFSAHSVSIFYGLVGVFMMMSSKIWSRQLDLKKGGWVLGSVNLILGVATLIPAVLSFLMEAESMGAWQIAILFISPMLFGSSMVTAVSSTTAFVKHNFPQNDWVYGIRIFTIAFAIGQIIGPFIVGFISDMSGGLGLGLLFSATILLIGSWIGFMQKPLALNHKNT